MAGTPKQHPKRYQNATKAVDCKDRIKKADIRRMARRGGVKRMAGDIYEQTRHAVIDYVEEVVRNAIMYTEHSKRKTVTSMDIVYALKRMGQPEKTIYL